MVKTYKDIALDLKGTLSGVPFGSNMPDARYVYQKTKPGLGNVPGDKTRTLQIRLQPAQYNPRTTQQVLNRLRFQAGVAAYKALTTEEKSEWKRQGRLKKLNGFQFFMRVWCKTQPQPTTTTWDAGSTTWDTGSTTWI